MVESSEFKVPITCRYNLDKVLIPRLDLKVITQTNKTVQLVNKKVKTGTCGFLQAACVWRQKAKSKTNKNEYFCQLVL